MTQGIALLCWLALLGSQAGSALGWTPSGCPSIRQSSVGPRRARFTVFSHFGYESGQTYSARADCNWQVDAPSTGISWRITFERIELETSSSAQRCKYDNLTVEYEFDGQRQTRVLCGRHTNLILVTNASFRLGFQSDSSVNQRGFKVYWEAVSQSQAIARSEISSVFRSDGSVGSCSRIERRGFPIRFAGNWYNTSILHMSANDRSYIHNADCSWFLRGSNPGQAIYITFEHVLLEGSPSAPCVLDNITVSYQLHRGPDASKRRVFCKLNRTIRLVSLGAAALQLRTDSSIGTGFNISWFAAPHLLVPGLFETSREFIEAQCPEITYTNRGGSIRLYYYPPQTYEPGMLCIWTVTVPPGKVAEFRFFRFELARSLFTMRMPHGYYNLTRRSKFCSTMDDSVTIRFKRDSTRFKRDSTVEWSVIGKFCENSDVSRGAKLLSAVGSVHIAFQSHRRRRYSAGRGFVLGFLFKDQQSPPDTQSSCPQPRQIDAYRSRIAVLPNEGPNLVRTRDGCSWVLRPRDSQHLMSLTVSLAGSPIDHHRLRETLLHSSVSDRPWFHSQFYGSCPTRVTVLSSSRMAADALKPTEASEPTPESIVSVLREVYCPPSNDRLVGLFSGPANVSITANRPVFSLVGFNLSITDIPKPKPGCSVVNISTEYTNNRAIKMFKIEAKAGCVVAEYLKNPGFSDVYSNTLLKVTFEFTCNRADSKQSLDIISQRLVTSIPCNGSKFLYDLWKYPLVLKFPDSTDSHVVSRVIYNFPVVESFCQSLDSRSGPRDNRTFGNIQLPLFIASGLLTVTRRHYSQAACNFELRYRPGYSILLRISHNLGFDDIDFFCHSKLVARDISPHIVLTATQRDPDSPGTWIERQLEMCHGYSIGSLGTKSELLVDGSVSLNLMALMKNSLTVPQMLRSILNQTQMLSLNFIISYEYVPSCPELQCRSLSKTSPNCRDIPVSSMKLEAQLARTPDTRTSVSECKWNIPTSSDMRQAMARQSNTWLVRLELSNFAFACPCHDCDTHGQHMTIGHKPEGDSPSSDRMVICGDYRTASRVLVMALTPSLPGIQVAYSAIESGINISVTFIDCSHNASLHDCRMAQAQVWGVKKLLLSEKAPGGLVFLAIVLIALLIGCLLYINREAVSSRVQAALQARQRRTDDTLQLTHETGQSD